MTSNYNITIKAFDNKKKKNAADAFKIAAFHAVVIL
jgi:hypothetical protein